MELHETKRPGAGTATDEAAGAAAAASPDGNSKPRAWNAGFFVLLLTVQFFLYFRHAGHFFQGDTIFLLNHRATTVTGYLEEFIRLNPSGWYRPLANELIESILYPVAGLHPVPYRIPVYLAFIAITLCVYTLGFVLAGRRITAAIAAYLFSIHSVNAYTTFDVGFMPELLYSFFYLAAVLAFFRYVNTQSRTGYRLSLFCFVASLMSKEAALTLPATLFLTVLLFSPEGGPLRARFVRALRAIAPHIAIVMVYLVFAIGYLHVIGISTASLLNQSQAPNPGDYIPLFNAGLLKNADLALSWAFNLPRGWWGQWQHLSPAMIVFLKWFRAGILAIAALMLVKPERKRIVFGLAWFWVTLSPALPLVTHFIPYYLFLPVAGLSLLAATVLTRLYDALNRIRPLAAGTSVALILAGMLYVTRVSIQADIRNNRLLGGSATLALNTLSDLRRLYPTLPPDAILYFEDANEHLAWEHDWGGLIRMAYGVDTISALYQGQGHALTPDAQNVFVFAVRNQHLVDETDDYRARPGIYMTFKDSDLKFELSAVEVVAGKDKYVLMIRGIKNVPVRIAYTFNGGPLETFNTLLDSDGEASFDVASYTRKGVYRFLAFNVSGTAEWIRAERTLTVR
jgi:hypothetical protein